MLSIKEECELCGKNYLPKQPVVPPAGAFPEPVLSEHPLLAFRCTPMIQPYLEEDTPRKAGIIIDAIITYQHVQDAVPIALPFDSEPLHVVISLDGEEVAHMDILPNSTNVEVIFPLAGHTPQYVPYTIGCTATRHAPGTSQNEHFYTTSSLRYIPDSILGSVTKIDHRTGMLLTKSATGKFEPIFPIGFYTSFGNYLDRNLSILDELKAQGFNTVHPVPPFHDLQVFTNILDRMEKLGLYLMYDMRHTYQDPQQRTREIELMKNYPNLLLWYTADEPDGPTHSLDATVTAYDAIYALDGYHPVSIALNCADHYFTEYAAGADIVIPDVYMVGNDVKYSSQYDTVCTADYGCCGCDNCQGELDDVARRLDVFKDRLRILGWDRQKALWSITQAFGGEEFWSRAPTGREWLVQALISINHGARGITPWIDPTPLDIKHTASLLARSLPSIVRFLADPYISFIHSSSHRVDIGMWSASSETLVVATNGDAVAQRYPLLMRGSKRGGVCDGWRREG
ncbi:hypothetical protein BDQ12DRAFT_701324 [Crucibulum laeve]|uniref:Glycoside hydrolase superfamily n=1 Tax=Crucibulum laeve TaxID=68775 RepID=A0A5C3LIT0_9AGAR|nr:hypothetical protein BDQ12DRAFT_701324 [Crucibulum laeve]